MVTRDRRELLRECLDRLAGQSRPPDAIVVVDNASSDGTRELLRKRGGVDVVTLSENAGGAGGFQRGVEQAYAGGHDWIWLVDDDTFAEPECLAALLAGAQRAPRPPSVLASAVRWRDGRLHPLNRGWFRWWPRADVAIAAGAGLVPLRTSTFVSALVAREAVARHGVPPGHYFIWEDDVEYTARLLREGAGYMVPDSVAVHWTATAHSTLTDTRERFYYVVRNTLWLLRSGSVRGRDRGAVARAYARTLVAYLRSSRPRRSAARTVLRGLRDGFGPEPR